MRPRCIPEVKNSRNKSHHVRLDIAGNGLKTSGRGVSPVELHRVLSSLDLCLQEHLWALKKGDVTASAVAEHVFEAGHLVDLSKASVIDYHPHTQTHCLLESWHIQHLSPISTERRAGPMPVLNATVLD